VLTGSLIRLILGVWTERYGGRLVFSAQMVLTGAATFALTWANSYATFLLAALGVGLAGGSFIIGVAYVSKWYPQARQGTALGVFGMGNVGAAVTKFLAPFVIVAWGWQGVAELWAAVSPHGRHLLPSGQGRSGFCRPARSGHRRAKPCRAVRAVEELQVWRFSLYYFFVFGGFVALALWLPYYLVQVYGVDVRTAGVAAAIFSLAASLFRAYGGVLSDRFGARTVMYWTLRAFRPYSCSCCPTRRRIT
jgi:NNP family nitrate/nitrite transporter-like MFS transporter